MQILPFNSYPFQREEYASVEQLISNYFTIETIKYTKNIQNR